MAGPYDYTLDVQQPLQSVLQGYQAGAAIRNDQMQVQQQQAAQAQLQRRQQILGQLAANPNATADDYASVITQLPDLAEPLQKAWTTRNTAQQQAHASDLLQWGAAIKSGRPDIAAQQINDRADVMEASNGGQPTPESQALRTNAQALQQNPQLALGKIQAMLAANPLGKDAAETLAKFGGEGRAEKLFPDQMREGTAKADAAEADAKTKAVQAKYAESAALKDLELKGWNVENIKSEIGYRKESSRIAAMNAAAAREGNALRREELSLKVQEARSALDEKIRTKAADYESGQATLQDALNLLTEIRSDPDTLEAATGTMAFRAAIPGTKARTVAGKIEQLQNTLAASNLDKLKGAMSDKDILFLKNITSNLDRYQSESGFIRELQKVEEVLIRGDKQLRNKFGNPTKPAPAVPSTSEGSTQTSQRNVTVDW